MSMVCPEFDAEWEQAKLKDCPGCAGALEQARSTDFPESDEGSEQEALWAGLDLDAEDCPAPAPVEESAADMGVCLRRDREGVHHNKEDVADNMAGDIRDDIRDSSLPTNKDCRSSSRRRRK
jgi:hypothetical protein